MDEAYVRREIYHMLHTQYSYYPITQTDALPCPKCHTLSKPPVGRPDIIVLNPTGRTVVVEVKALRGKSFSMDQIEEKQHKWLDRWANDSGYGYIAIGTMIPRHRRLWIIDWDFYREVEDLISPIQRTIPLVAGKGYRREMQDNHLDFKHLFPDWEMTRITGSWEFPTNHTIRRIDEGNFVGQRETSG